VPTGPCVADFYAEPTHLQGHGWVNFTSTSTGDIQTLRWIFGNGRTGVGWTPRTYYSKDGYYTVTLIIAGPDSNDVMTKVDYIEVTGC